MRGPPLISDLQRASRWVAILHGIVGTIIIVVFAALLITHIIAGVNAGADEKSNEEVLLAQSLVGGAEESPSSNTTDKVDKRTETKSKKDDKPHFFEHEGVRYFTSHYVEQQNFDFVISLLAILLLLFAFMSCYDVQLYRGARDRNYMLCNAWAQVWLILWFILLISVAPVFLFSVAFSLGVFMFFIFQMFFLFICVWIVIGFCTELAHEAGHKPRIFLF